MRILNPLFVAVLALFLAVSLPAYTQDRDESRPAQGHEDKDKAKDKDNDKAARPQQDRDRAADRQQDRAQDRNAQDRDRAQDRNAQRHEERAENNGQHARPAAAKGKKIPDQKFHQTFGKQHTFKVQRTQIINNPQPVVVYGGYNFQLIDTWPTVWSFDDPVYIDYDPVEDMYFMFDPFHPEARVAVMVVGGF